MSIRSDSEELKTDSDNEEPPTGKSRNSMDETEQQIVQLQTPATPITPRESSSSPRPPPRQPPPPVPPTKPTKKDINHATNSLLLNLDEKVNTYSKSKRRRRRASLPTLNILPSFNSLKSVMGFGVDEDDKTNDDDDNNSNN
eukprot:305662_1